MGERATTDTGCKPAAHGKALAFEHHKRQIERAWRDTQSLRELCRRHWTEALQLAAHQFDECLFFRPGACREFGGCFQCRFGPRIRIDRAQHRQSLYGEPER